MTGPCDSEGYWSGHLICGGKTVRLFEALPSSPAVEKHIVLGLNFRS